RKVFLSADSLALKSEDRQPGLVHGKDASGTFVLRMPSSYVYLSGELRFDAVVAGGSIEVSLSDSQGRGWKPVATVTASGPQKVDLGALVLRRYDYRLKFVLNGKSGLDSLRLLHDIQHSQRALPALGQGENKITFSAGPQEGTIALEGAGSKFAGKQVTAEELGAVLTNVKGAP